jgi:hypothetical protein
VWLRVGILEYALHRLFAKGTRFSLKSDAGDHRGTEDGDGKTLGFE